MNSPPKSGKAPCNRGSSKTALNQGYSARDQAQAFCEVHHSISMETVFELKRRSLLHISGNRWRLGDESNGTTRRLDNTKWKRGDNKGQEWHKLIGLSDVIHHDRKHVLFTIEGSKDALAAAEIAHRWGKLSETGILCAQGSGYRPIKGEIEQLRGRRVVVIGDNDEAGWNTILIVSNALAQAGVEYFFFNWAKCPENIKDIYSLLVEFPEQAEKQLSALFKRVFFSLSLPSYRSTVQPFNCSTNTASIGKDELLGIVTPHIVSAKGSGNAMSFRLARAIKNRKFSTMQIEEIFKLWFEKSKLLLPPDAHESKSMETFHRQMQRVRFTEPALNTAIERARSAKRPFVAARDGDEEIELLAALCRELQRDAGDKPFICPVNVAQQFLGLRFATAANRLIHELEDEGVIECVDRGAPHKRGQKGKPSFWRYKLPMEDRHED